MKDLLAWQPVMVDAAILERGWKLQDRYQLSFWDALIVAAAKSIGCRYLLTEDLQTNQDLDGILVISPFLTDPDIPFPRVIYGRRTIDPNGVAFQCSFRVTHLDNFPAVDET